MAKKKTRDSGSELLKYLEMAVDLEKSSTKFYTQAKSKVKDYNMKVLLNVLLDKEKEHLASVTKMRNLIKYNRTEEAGKEARHFKAAKLKNPFKDRKQAQKISKSSSIFGIFKKAIDMEKSASRFYLNAAKRAKSKDVKDYLKKLSKDEMIHQDYIKKHKEALYDYGYWYGITQPRIES